MIKIIAIVCRIANPTDCFEQTAHFSDKMSDCELAPAALAQWFAEQHYDKQGYFAKGWKCQFGSRATERAA